VTDAGRRRIVSEFGFKGQENAGPGTGNCDSTGTRTLGLSSVFSAVASAWLSVMTFALVPTDSWVCLSSS